MATASSTASERLGVDQHQVECGVLGVKHVEAVARGDFEARLAKRFLRHWRKALPDDQDVSAGEICGGHYLLATSAGLTVGAGAAAACGWVAGGIALTG